MHVPLDAFTPPGAERPATFDQALNRLSRERVKDTSIDFKATQDYVEARAALAAQRAEEAALAAALEEAAAAAERRSRTLPARFDAFLEQRGLPHPAEVLQSVRDYANEVFSRRRALGPEDEIRLPDPMDPHVSNSLDASSENAATVPVPAVSRPAPDPALLLAPVEDIREALNRLDHVQQHSAAMNHEGLARRSAFHTAENELTLCGTAEALRAYADRVADIIAPSLVVAIGRTLPDAHDEPRLAHLSEPTREALQTHWTDVHAASRATFELGLLETARDIDTSYRQERQDRAILADYEAGIAAAIAPAEAEPKAKTRLPDWVPSAQTGHAPERAQSDVAIAPEGRNEPVSRPAAPVLAAVTHWPLPLDQAVARAVEAHPMVRTGLRVARDGAARIWREPDAAFAKILEAFERQPDDAHALTQALQSEPEAYGELQGGRTLLRRPDRDRQQALEAVPAFSSSMLELVEVRARLTAPLRTKEEQWRQRMAQPLPALSPEAMALVQRLAQAREMRPGDRETAHRLAVEALAQEAAVSEIKRWRQDVQSRLAPADAIERIPGLDKAGRAELKALVSSIEASVQEVDRTVAVEAERRRSLQQSLDLDLGHSA